MSLSVLSGCGLSSVEVAALGSYELDTAAMRAAVLEEADLGTYEDLLEAAAKLALGTYELDTAAMRAAVLEEAGMEEPNSFVLSMVRTIEAASGSLLLKGDLTFELRYRGQGTDDLQKGTWTLDEDKLTMVIQEEAGPATTVARLADGAIMMTLGEHAIERRPFRKVVRKVAREAENVLNLVKLVKMIESASGSLSLKEDMTFERRYRGLGLEEDLTSGTWTLQEDKLKLITQEEEESGPVSEVARLTDGLIMLGVGKPAYERRPFRKVKK